MIDQKVADQVFETFLKMAVIQNHDNELAAIPSEAELSLQHSFSPQFAKRVQGLIWRDRYIRAKRSASNYMVKIAVGFIIILVLTFSAVMTMPEVRAAVFDVVIEWFNDHTSYRFSENTETQDSTSPWTPAYLPENFYQASITKTGEMTTVIYKNDHDQLIYLIYASAHEGFSLAIDNEHTSHALIMLNGIQADLFKAQTEEDNNHIIWQINRTSLHIFSNINCQELIKIAESINKSK